MLSKALTQVRTHKKPGRNVTLCKKYTKLSIPWSTWSTCLAHFPFFGWDPFYIHSIFKSTKSENNLIASSGSKSWNCGKLSTAWPMRQLVKQNHPKILLQRQLGPAKRGKSRESPLHSMKTSLWTSADVRSLNWAYSSPNLTRKRLTKLAYRMHNWYNLKMPHVVLNHPSIDFILVVTLHAFCCKCPTYNNLQVTSLHVSLN